MIPHSIGSSSCSSNYARIYIVYLNRKILQQIRCLKNKIKLTDFYKTDLLIVTS